MATASCVLDECKQMKNLNKEIGKLFCQGQKYHLLLLEGGIQHYDAHKKRAIPSHLARIAQKALGSKQAALRSRVSSSSLVDENEVQRITHFSTKSPKRSAVLQKFGKGTVDFQGLSVITRAL